MRELAPQELEIIQNKIKQLRDNKIRKCKEEKMKRIDYLVKERC